MRESQKSNSRFFLIFDFSHLIFIRLLSIKNKNIFDIFFFNHKLFKVFSWTFLSAIIAYEARAKTKISIKN